jgi:xanthine/CO dehydrogenase XdhC/CoxF family maturation factor
MLSEQRAASHNIGDGDLAEAILDDSQHVLESGRSKATIFATATGRAEVFIEVIQPSIPFVIFGAGQDAVPLVRFAKELGWHVTLVDPRPGYATPTRFPLADTLIVCRPEEVCERIKINSRTVAAVMTHNFLHDSELLRILWPSPLRYLGILGSGQRTRRLLDQVQGTGQSHRDHSLGLVYGPMGLDIGADTPEEIALAVVAEIKAVLTGRSGGMLRTREGPLHERSDAVDMVTVSGKKTGVVHCGHGQ